MIIDSHQHVFWHGKDDRGLVADMEEQGIDLAWLLTWELLPEHNDPAVAKLLNPAHVRLDGTHPGIPLSDLLLARSRYPEKFVLGYCPNPALDQAPDLLEAAVNIHGVKVCGEWKFRMLIDDPRCIELFRRAGELGLPVVLHLDVPWVEGKFQQAWHGGTIENLARTLLACPKTNFIGHAPGFWREIAVEEDNRTDGSKYPTGKISTPGRLGALFDNHPNLFADLSAQSGLNALRRDPVHARKFIERFSDRLLFGRDYYGGELTGFLATLDLTAKQKEMIYAGNAQRLLGGN